METRLESLQKEFNFILEDSKTDKGIKFIIFENGKKYKLQSPGFFDLHDALSEEHWQTALFKLGLTKLFSENAKSPVIDEVWLEANQNEGLNLWAPLIRGLLRRPPT